MLVSVDCVMDVPWVLEIMADHDYGSRPEALLCCQSIVCSEGKDILLRVEKEVAIPYCRHLARLSVHTSLYVSVTRGGWNGGAEGQRDGMSS